MTPEQEATKAKQHDPEETPREKARRLVARWTKGRADSERLYAARLSRHARYLSDSDRTELLEHLEGRHQLLIERLRDEVERLGVAALKRQLGGSRAEVERLRETLVEIDRTAQYGMRGGSSPQEKLERICGLTRAALADEER